VPGRARPFVFLRMEVAGARFRETSGITEN
jgi:hypothetical protein